MTGRIVTPEEAQAYLEAIKLPFAEHDEFTDDLAFTVEQQAKRIAAVQERVARAMYYRVMEETRDEWPLFDYLPEAAQRNWRESAARALGVES